MLWWIIPVAIVALGAAVIAFLVWLDVRLHSDRPIHRSRRGGGES